MEFFVVLALMAGMAFSVGAYIRYAPRFDLVESGKGYILFFWYNKYDSWDDGYYTRRYIIEN